MEIDSNLLMPQVIDAKMHSKMYTAQHGGSPVSCSTSKNLERALWMSFDRHNAKETRDQRCYLVA